jgi:arylsulfatase A-like enzyme
MRRTRSRSLFAAILTTVAVGLVWGLLDGLATWDRSCLFLEPGQVGILVAGGVVAGGIAGGLAGLFAAIVPRLRAPLPAGALALAGITLIIAASRLVREPVLGRDVQLLPGGVYSAAVVSLAVALLPLALVIALERRRLLAAIGVWKIWAVALVLATWFTPRTTAAPRPTASAPEQPNLLLITLDTFRADHVGALGADGDPTPALDELASEGALFTRAYSQIPTTGPSHMSILSGTYPWTHETLANGVAVPPDVPVLPQMLGTAGYRTAAFVSAFVLDGVFGYGRGFEVYDDALVRPKGVSDLSPMRVWEQLRVRFGDLADVERPGDVTVHDALGWLERRRPDERFFLWVHLFDAHGPYEPPPPFDTRYYSGDPRDPAHTTMTEAVDVADYMAESLEGITDLAWPLAQYKGEIAFTDQQLGRLLEGLADQGLAENTVIVVVADHGESLDEHDYYFNHGAHLYTPSMHVPLVIVAPGRIPAGVVVDDLVENVDLAPTLLELLGQPVPADLAGTSLLPLVDGAAHSDGESLSVTFDREANQAMRAFMRYRKIGIRTDGYSFIYREEGPEEWYALETDPGEETDLSRLATHAFLIQDHVTRSEQILDAAGSGAHERGELGASARERLENLGYIEKEDDPVGGSE